MTEDEKDQVRVIEALFALAFNEEYWMPFGTSVVLAEYLNSNGFELEFRGEDDCGMPTEERIVRP